MTNGNIDPDYINFILNLQAELESGNYTRAHDQLKVLVQLEFERRIAGLLGSKELAILWGVSIRRAQAKIAALYYEKGIGIQLGGTFFLSRDEAEQHRPKKSAGRPASRQRSVLKEQDAT